MVNWLNAGNCHAVHAFDLPNGNQTSDQQIIETTDREQRVLITKDADFVDRHVLHNRPAKLLLISTGNITNRDLEALFVPSVPQIVQTFA